MKKTSKPLGSVFLGVREFSLEFHYFLGRKSRNVQFGRQSELFTAKDLKKLEKLYGSEDLVLVGPNRSDFAESFLRFRM